jgi:RND family efflux transporter MFP subunit
MKIKILFFICLLCWMNFFIGCGREKPNRKPLTAVRVQPVEEQITIDGFRYSANIMPYTQINLSFRVGGYIERILQIKGADGRMRNLQEGDIIPQGTVLARVREADYIAKLNMAKSALAEAMASFINADINFKRSANLFKTDSITEKEYDNAKTVFDSAKARTDGAKAQVDEAEIALRDCSLKAPMPVQVMKRNIETGTLVSSGTTGFVVADTSSVKASFGVPDVLLSSLVPGSPQKVFTEVFHGKEFRGIITAISPSADPYSRVFDVEITIPNKDNRLKAGMIVSLETTGSKLKKPILAVPLNAIVRPKNNPSGYALYVVEEKEGKSFARIRNIKAGDVLGNMLAVTEGVKKGERIIITGATLVVDGEEVNIVL